MNVSQPVVSGPGQANPQRAMILLIGLPIAAFFVFGLTLAFDYPTDRNGMIGMALLTIVVALVPVILDQARPAERRHMLLTVYCLLFVAHFGLPIFTQYAIVQMPSDPPGVSGGALFPADIVVGQGVVLIGLVSLLIGYAILPLGLSDAALERRSARDWPPSVVPIVAVMMLILGWMVTLAGSLGLIPAALGSGIISTIGSSVYFGNALLTVAAIRDRARIAWAMLAVSVPISVAMGFTTGSKQATLMVPAIVLFTSMLLGGRLRARWIAFGVLSLMLLYPINEFYRSEVLARNFTMVDAVSNPVYTLRVLSDFVSNSRTGSYLVDGLAATAGRLDGVGIVSVIVRDTPSRSPFQRGRTLALFPLAFIPRFFWPSKPEITLGQWITDTYGSGSHISSYTGPTFIGDLYLNFGVASVAIGMLLVGAVMRFFQSRFLGPKPTMVGILAAIVLIIQFHIKQIGSAAYVLSSTAFALAPVLVVYFVIAFLVGGKPVRVESTWSTQGNSISDPKI